jgi:hypothetical protein
VYEDVGDAANAEENYGKMLVLDPHEESQRAVGAWYIRIGQRAQGEQLLAKVYVERVCWLSIR